MAAIQKRGQLTPQIKQKSKELLGYEISQDELRLLVYVLYQAVNEKSITRVNQKEKEILSTWAEKGFLLITGLGNLLSISKDFWDNANELIYLGYVNTNL
jgi:hypothetical protein